MNGDPSPNVNSQVGRGALLCVDFTTQWRHRNPPGPPIRRRSDRLRSLGNGTCHMNVRDIFALKGRFAKTNAGGTLSNSPPYMACANCPELFRPHGYFEASGFDGQDFDFATIIPNFPSSMNALRYTGNMRREPIWHVTQQKFALRPIGIPRSYRRTEQRV